jgi:hypothetical protein
MVAFVAAVAAAAAWWAVAVRQTALERQIAGDWTQDQFRRAGVTFTTTFAPDGQCRTIYESPIVYTQMVYTGPPYIGEPCWWSARGDALIFDTEPSRLRRALRPVASLIGIPTGSACRCQVEVAAGRMVVTYPDGTMTEYTGAPAD